MRRIVKGVGCCVAMLALCGCTQQTALFNGQNLEDGKPIWRTPLFNPARCGRRDSVLHCKGTPTGYAYHRTLQRLCS